MDERGAGSRWRPPTGEVGIALGFATVSVLLTAGLVRGWALVPAIALGLGHTLPLAWRRRAPEAVLGVQAATAVVVTASGWPVVALGPAVLAGVHGLGTTRPREQGVPVLGATVLAMALLVSVGGARVDTVVGNGVALAVAWWMGDRQRRTAWRAEEAERSADALARDAVAAERLRIARELHDVVAHALSVIAVQAGTGRVLVDADVEQARSALTAIEQESRTALGEMRRLLEVLREESGEDGPRAPSPGLDDLTALVASTERSGLATQLRTSGARLPLPAGVELALYRIVQEALTNARRHAAATAAEVRVTWLRDAVEVEVLDDGRGAGAEVGGGHGLLGMRERAALYGGCLEVGDRPGGGFRVAARLPVGSDA